MSDPCGSRSDVPTWSTPTSGEAGLPMLRSIPASLSAQQIQNHYSQRSNGGKEVADKHP